ncbi:uncharacterized protein BX664DRAFT_335943 [Halteromyces radiatus]|uniref:uncharacterized protein n=1 Tax=Halteromyces radiatus TaxID=101107 RepID=UPI00221F82B8|nr:uncharacterized protein BX664DRAFT_335943 [Halteromyces radiatus]KAI8086494.1 hypothetical protein BX664DRAFT_335943 [Halteromyces radiatus]
MTITKTITQDKQQHFKGPIFESDSPEPTLLKVTKLDPIKDYRTQPWKNGLGTTSEIGIYPPEKDFTLDSFFWRFSIHTIKDNCYFSLFPGYDCTTIVLPNENNATFKLNHQDRENFSTIKPLFPYTWHGEWETHCRMKKQPVTTLQFMIKRDLGKAQFYVEKIGQPVSNESGETGKRLILGVFCLVYVVEGHVRISLDDSTHQSRVPMMAGQTLCIERDEDASPTNMMIQASDEQGIVGNDDTDANVVIIQISETKQHETSSISTTSEYFTSPHSTNNKFTGTPSTTTTPITPSSTATTTTTTTTTTTAMTEYDAPSARRRRDGTHERRRSSLVLYDDQGKSAKPKQDLVLDDDSTSSTTIIADITKSENKETSLDAKWTDQLKQTTTSIDEAVRRDSVATLLRGSLDPAQMYVPPTAALMNKDTDVPPPVVRDRLVIEDYAEHTVSTAWIKMIEQGLSEWIRLPVIICRGSDDGPVVGITAAVHGNELNGVPCIHRVVSEIDVHKLKGTVVAIPCVNVVGYLKFQREFADGRDLNRQFPGKEDGFSSQVYCYQLMHKIISQFNYLIDLHTASFGRINSYYVRADMNDIASATLAHLQQPQIVLHNSGQDGTLRSAASARGIKAITVEIGNPQLFQNQYVQWSYFGVMRILDHLEMYALTKEPKEDQDNRMSQGPPSTILCSKGFWIYTRTGGILEVYPGVNSIIRKGDTIARVKNIFGNLVDTYFAPCSGIVIGRSSNPVAMAGDRILHLGVIKKKGEVLPKEAKENY